MIEEGPSNYIIEETKKNRCGKKYCLQVKSDLPDMIFQYMYFFEIFL